MSSIAATDIQQPSPSPRAWSHSPVLDWRVDGQQQIRYDVTLSRNLFDADNPTLARGCGADGANPARRLFVVDSIVEGFYGHQIRDYCSAWNINAIFKVVSGSESSKTLEQAVAVADAMTGSGLLRRHEAVVAVGGGVVLDIVGLAASLYRRGIPYIRVPTTLMGLVDAGIGVKTGVNHGLHKNRLGTYFAPTAAFLDPTFLRTLDQRHVANGVAEIIKMALIKDVALFDLVERMIDRLTGAYLFEGSDDVMEMLARAIGGMLDELEPNLWEAVLERVVDYGHTFSPSLELRADPPLLHGEAVAVDMALSVGLSLGRNLMSASDADRAVALIHRAGLPLHHPMFTLDLLVSALEDSRKHRDGLQRVPLSVGIGQAVFVNDLTTNELERALAWLEHKNAQWPLQ